MGLFIVLFIADIAQHGRAHGTSAAGDFRPSLGGFLTVIGVLVFMWVGFELSTGAAEEMRHPRRDVPTMIVRSGILAAVLYGLVIVGIILVIPKSQLSSVSGFAHAFSSVSATFHSRALDSLFAALVIMTLIGSGAVRLEGADRTQANAALDGAAPSWMGRFTSFGTPIAVNLSSGVTAPGLPQPCRIRNDHHDTIKNVTVTELSVRQSWAIPCEAGRSVHGGRGGR